MLDEHPSRLKAVGLVITEASAIIYMGVRTSSQSLPVLYRQELVPQFLGRVLHVMTQVEWSTYGYSSLVFSEVIGNHPYTLRLLHQGSQRTVFAVSGEDAVIKRGTHPSILREYTLLRDISSLPGYDGAKIGLPQVALLVESSAATVLKISPKGRLLHLNKDGITSSSLYTSCSQSKTSWRGCIRITIFIETCRSRTSSTRWMGPSSSIGVRGS